MTETPKACRPDRRGALARHDRRARPRLRGPLLRRRRPRRAAAGRRRRRRDPGPQRDQGRRRGRSPRPGSSRSSPARASGSTTSTYARPPRPGVMVVNAPQSNIVSAAELAVGLLLAAARHIPAATASLKTGEWKRSKFTGVELYEKTAGIVGLGRIGALVAQRLSAFGMQRHRVRPVRRRRPRSPDGRAPGLARRAAALERRHLGAPAEDPRDGRAHRRRASSRSSSRR